MRGVVAAEWEKKCTIPLALLLQLRHATGALKPSKPSKHILYFMATGQKRRKLFK